MSIGIIDYGMANLRSVQKAFETVGVNAQIISTPEEIAFLKEPESGLDLLKVTRRVEEPRD